MLQSLSPVLVEFMVEIDRLGQSQQLVVKFSDCGALSQPQQLPQCGLESLIRASCFLSGSGAVAPANGDAARLLACIPGNAGTMPVHRA